MNHGTHTIFLLNVFNNSWILVDKFEIYVNACNLHKQHTVKHVPEAIVVHIT